MLSDLEFTRHLKARGWGPITCSQNIEISPTHPPTILTKKPTFFTGYPLQNLHVKCLRSEWDISSMFLTGRDFPYYRRSYVGLMRLLRQIVWKYAPYFGRSSKIFLKHIFYLTSSSCRFAYQNFDLFFAVWSRHIACMTLKRAAGRIRISFFIW